MNKKNSLLLTLLLLISVLNIGNVVTVVAIYNPEIGVYWDADCTIPVYNFTWGTFEPPETKYQTIYLKNTGNCPIYWHIINMENLTPANFSDYMEITFCIINETAYAGAIGRVQVVDEIWAMSIKVEALQFDFPYDDEFYFETLISYWGWFGGSAFGYMCAW